MPEEKNICWGCSADYYITWLGVSDHEDYQEDDHEDDLLIPNFCPFCGVELAFGEEDEWYE